jgi:hypothetical protein
MLPDAVVGSSEMLPPAGHVTMSPPSPGRHHDQQDDTHTVRVELAHAVRRRYRSATGKEKHKILDEFIATTGYHDKSVIRVLNAEPVRSCSPVRLNIVFNDFQRFIPQRTTGLGAHGFA